MSITRAQQAKQMLQNGGRIGLQGGGRDMSTVSAKDIGIGDSESKREYSPSEKAEQRATQRLNERIEQNRQERERQRLKQQLLMTPIGRNKPLGPLSLFNANFQRNMDIKLAKKRYDDLISRLDDYVVGDTDMDYDFSGAPVGLATLTSNKGTSAESTRPNLYTVNPNTSFPSTLGLIQDKIRPDTQVTLQNTLDKAKDYRNLVADAKNMTNQEIKDALTELQNRGKTPDQINPIRDNDGSEPIIPVDTTFAETPVNQEDYYASVGGNPFAGEGLRLAFRADGGRIGAQEGGIMNNDVVGGEYDFESARQMYGLGKLVKKVTRTVKKIAKSPVGKAALAGAAVYGLGGGTFFGKTLPGISTSGGFAFRNIAPNLLGVAGVGEVGGTKGILSSLGLTKGYGSFMPSALGAIAGVSALAGLLTAKQEEEAQELSRGEGIDIDAARRSILARAQGNIPGDLRATAFLAEGGRIGLRNGGDDDADDQESSYDDGPLLIPDDADLSPDDFYGRKEREGIMKMASAVGDETDEISEEMFGKPVKDLNPSEFKELMDYLDNLRKKFMAEGGPAKGKEPVAKKTMPLLDMGGKEMDLREEGGFVPIGRMEKADDVPARLSKNEFVFTADAVRNAGDGDVDKGAEVMYNMMKNLEAGGEVSEESQGLEGARKMFQTSQRLEEVL